MNFLSQYFRLNNKNNNSYKFNNNHFNCNYKRNYVQPTNNFSQQFKGFQNSFFKFNSKFQPKTNNFYANKFFQSKINYRNYSAESDNELSNGWRIKEKTFENIQSDIDKIIQKSKEQLENISYQWENNEINRSESKILTLTVSKKGTSHFQFLFEKNPKNEVEIKEVSRSIAWTHSFFEGDINKHINTIMSELSKNK